MPIIEVIAELIGAICGFLFLYYLFFWFIVMLS